MNNVETKLAGELLRELEQLSSMEVGTDQYKTTVDGLTKLMSTATEMEKLHIEADDKVETRKAENEFKQKQLDADNELKHKQLKSEKLDQITRNVITGVSVAGGFILTIWGTIKSIKFEETGTITTFAGRQFFNKLFSKK